MSWKEAIQRLNIYNGISPIINMKKKQIIFKFN